VVLYALAGGPLWHFLVRPWEETDLERRFGEPYRAYRAAVKCWLPRVRGYRP
jgi:protein-S-isoprenylcysteine O-methyltransferase Ste14